LQARGVLTGVGGNKFNPGGEFTRAGVVQIVYNLISQIADKDVTGVTVANDFVIRKTGVTLKDTTVKGDLVIAQGVGDGDVWLDNVDVKGQLLVYGGGSNSVHIKGNSKVPNVIVNKPASAGNQTVSVKVEGAASVPLVTVIGNNVIVTGNIAKLVIDSPDAIVTLAEGATVTELIIHEAAAGVSVTVNAGATVTTATVAANDVGIVGDGTVTNVTVAKEVTTVTTVGTPNATIENNSTAGVTDSKGTTIATAGTTGKTSSTGDASTTTTTPATDNSTSSNNNSSSNNSSNNNSSNNNNSNNNNNDTGSGDDIYASASTLEELQALFDDEDSVVQTIFLANDITIGYGETLTTTPNKSIYIIGVTLTVASGGTIAVDVNSQYIAIGVGYGGNLVVEDGGQITGSGNRVQLPVNDLEGLKEALDKYYVDSIVLNGVAEIATDEELTIYASKNVFVTNYADEYNPETGYIHYTSSQLTVNGTLTVNGNLNISTVLADDGQWYSGELINNGTIKVEGEGIINIEGKDIYRYAQLYVDGNVSGDGTITSNDFGSVSFTASDEPHLRELLEVSYVNNVLIQSDLELEDDLIIPAGKSVNVSPNWNYGVGSNASLTVPSDVTITVRGTLYFNAGTVNGATLMTRLINNGTIDIVAEEGKRADLTVYGVLSGAGDITRNGENASFWLAVRTPNELSAAVAPNATNTNVEILGNITITANLTIPADKILQINGDYTSGNYVASSLTIAPGITLTVDGYVYFVQGNSNGIHVVGKLINNGAIVVNQGGYIDLYNEPDNSLYPDVGHVPGTISGDGFWTGKPNN
jgi:hypothetical protein